MLILVQAAPVTYRQIWLNLGGLGDLVALLRLAYWLNTGAQAVPGLLGLPRWTGLAWRV